MYSRKKTKVEGILETRYRGPFILLSRKPEPSGVSGFTCSPRWRQSGLCSGPPTSYRQFLRMPFLFPLRFMIRVCHTFPSNEDLVSPYSVLSPPCGTQLLLPHPHPVVPCRPSPSGIKELPPAFRGISPWSRIASFGLLPGTLWDRCVFLYTTVSNGPPRSTSSSIFFLFLKP